MSDDHDWREWAQRDQHWKWHVAATLDQLIQQGRTIMTKLEEIQAALAATAASLDALGTNVTEIGDGVVGLDTEVKALLALIQSNPDVPQAIVDAANAVAAKSAALVTQTQAVEDQIAQIPPASPPPAQG